MIYSNKGYWNKLVGNEMSLREVGWPEWTESYNYYRYKLTSELTKKALDSNVKNMPVNILEIGCGVGFWTQFISNLYPKSKYYGIDISSLAIENLSKRNDLKNIQFINIDFGVPFDLLPEEIKSQKFDVIVCFEVLLHIVDDQAWNNALQNICKLLSKDGVAFLSEPFYYYNKKKGYNPRSINYVREYDDYINVLNECHKEVIQIEPRTFLLDNNFDFKYQLSAYFWKIFFIFHHRILSIKSERLGAVLGRVAYFFDKIFIANSKYGNTCRLIVFH